MHRWVGASVHGAGWVGGALRSNVVPHVAWSLVIVAAWIGVGVAASMIGDPSGRSAGYVLAMGTAVGLWSWLLLLVLGAPLNALVAVAAGIALRTEGRDPRRVGVTLGVVVWVVVTLRWLDTRAPMTPEQILSGETPVDPALALAAAIVCGTVFGLLLRRPGKGVVLRLPSPPPPVTPRV
jgi:hypothetical protein